MANKKSSQNKQKEVNNKSTTSNSKQEEIVFKNSKSSNKKDASSDKLEVKKAEESKNKKDDTKNTAEVKVENKNTEEKKQELIKSTENTQDKRRKIFIITAIVAVSMLIILAFSTVFAIGHAAKDRIARGVSIRNIDVSNLTYNEAKDKLEKAFNVGLEVNINLTYEDFSHIITSSDIGLKYELSKSLQQAYNIGRSGNIVKNNYELLLVALMNKNINVKYQYDEEALDKVIEYVSTNVPNLVKQSSYYIDGETLIINSGVDGNIVENDKLKSKIIDEIQNRDLIKLLSKVEESKISIPYKEAQADKIDIEKIYNEVKKEAQNAYYVEATETTEFEIHPDVDGVDFAISLDEAKQIVSEEGLTEYRIPLSITKAQVTIKDIGIEAFPYLVGESQSVYDASNKNRSENLRIAATKINGTVLMPGEQFSFNRVVGERTISEGYKNAAIYSDGQVVDGLAGGICQVSSTLYNAVLDSNLQIDERHNHSFTTSYYRAGRDATVVYGIKDFKFTNTRTYPIRISASVSNGVAKFLIHGIKEEKEYDVKIIPVTTETTPFTTQTIVDYTLAPGATVVSQGGASGCKVTTYKEVYLNGVQVSREVISNDVYQVMTRVVKVGPTATAPTSAPTPTPAPAPAETPVVADTPVETPPAPVEVPEE